MPAPREVQPGTRGRSLSEKWQPGWRDACASADTGFGQTVVSHASSREEAIERHGTSRRRTDALGPQRASSRNRATFAASASRRAHSLRPGAYRQPIVCTIFLLGSGISIDAGMPRVTGITAQVLSGEGVILHTDEAFACDPSNPNFEWLRRRVEPVLELVHDLDRAARKYLPGEPTYEHLASLAAQIHDALTGDYETAAVMPFAMQLREQPYAGGEAELLELTRLAQSYIADTVRWMLDRKPSGVDHLRVITEACGQLGDVTLATLNHDLVLETALDAGEVAYGDGFERVDEDVRRWADDWTDQSVRVLKLHGSIDWWGYDVPGEPWRGWIAARYVGVDPMHPRRAGFDLPNAPRPIFLTGTFDKILAYESWLFPDQHMRFHEALRAARRVIVIGYGFGDKAINSRLIGWLARRREHRLIVCHPNPAALRSSARPAIARRWNEWRQDGQLAVIESYVGDLEYASIAEHVSAS